MSLTHHKASQVSIAYHTYAVLALQVQLLP